MNKFSLQIIKTTLLAVIVFFNYSVFAQSDFSLVSGADLKVTGTSTLHDWDMKSSTATGKAQITLENGKVVNVKNVTITMPAESIKSGKSGMDKNAYTALKTKNHKDVKFTLKELIAKGNGFEATGDFTIAGVTKSAKFPVTASVAGDKVTFKGQHDFKLTDYNIDPPTALMGTVKTGNEVSIHFNVTFQPTK
ncbi:YceI family protein [Belliella pelovolcani]|uniref:YceI-like domain-containing protein n=1 Tax=Belliella pelovolcani TaxID=529505 RepID=A0A1N7NR56_9BACT|nr:YceI family protein [Belliella pelovolcani]SIT00750.1 YceI-like domain-containing protein [Belliella pelovolcani]